MKRALFIILAGAFGTAVLPAAPLAPPTPADVDAIAAEGFPAAGARLDALIRENYRPGTGSMRSNASHPTFQSWYLLGKWARLLSRPGIEVDPAFAREAMTRSAFLQDFLLNLADSDDAARALKILQDIWRQNPDLFWQYSRLAIAIALVFDQPPPADWPHHQVRPGALPKPVMTGPEAFAFWVDSAKANRLYHDPKSLAVDQLKFMVDVFLPPAELRWAQKNARFPRSDFGKAFSSIAYDHARLVARRYDWPFDTYSLEQIRKAGGICVDQAYFAAVAGKANGLPTLFFSGQGSDGGHAWFGYLKAANHWELDCGRYENQNYAVGQAVDPQTWQPISDAQIEYLAKPAQRSPGFQQSAVDLAIARLYSENRQNDKAVAAVSSAIAAAPENVNAWTEKLALLTEPAAQKAHLEKALNQFSANRDLRAFFQKEMANWHRRQGDIAKAVEWDQKIISQNRSERSDLSVTAAAESLKALVNAKQMDEAMKEYRSLLNRLGRKGGGNFYYEIVAPFVDTLLTSGDIKSAQRALELARRALQPEMGSILDMELRGLEFRAGMKMN